jgi:SulP family sulfate permease
MRPGLTDICLFAQPINRIDVTGAEVFGTIRRMLESKGVRLHLSGLKLPAQQVLERAGLLAPGPLLFIYRTDADALAALGKLPPPDRAEASELSPAPACADS